MCILQLKLWQYKPEDASLCGRRVEGKSLQAEQNEGQEAEGGVECESYLATKAEGTGHPSHYTTGKQKTGKPSAPSLMTKWSCDLRDFSAVMRRDDPVVQECAGAGRRAGSTDHRFQMLDRADEKVRG